ncbi:DUF5605 domain-containing protein [Streptomyces sp. NPDC059679]
MTIDRVGVATDTSVRVALPGRPYMAIRVTRLPDDPEAGK